MKLSVSVDIVAPKKNVWDAITDIGNSTNMISGLIAVTILHQPVAGLVGLKWTETRKMFGKEASETMWITDSEDEAYYRTRAENHGAVYVSKLSITETDGTTRLDFDFSMTSTTKTARLFAWVLGSVMKRSMTKMILADLNDIKKFVESRA